MYKRSIGAMIFNKSILAKKPEIGNPYDYVKNGTWTLEQMISMASDTEKDYIRYRLKILNYKRKYIKQSL